MPDLTREQIRGLRAAAEGRIAAALVTNANAHASDPEVVPLMKLHAGVVVALATEVLAQRERRCETCCHYSGVRWGGDTGACEYEGNAVCWVTPNWFCADWTAKEER